MEDLNRLCMGCMREKPGIGVCPYCHFSLEKYEPPMYHLKPQTIVSGKYLVGKSIGEGGFGITYIGWDLNLEIPLAIKEYFPNGFAIRDHHTSDHVTAFTGEKEKFYKAGREKFVQEAKSLAKFYKQEEIVLVRDYFQENGTAYIVMEYIVGKSYNEILREKERNHTHPSVEEVFETMRPVIKALEMVHNEGIIHRDISPDNIMITEDGVTKLIDFGAARGFSDGEKSFSIVLKAGYAPEEQYRTRGHQGPWTDVYALCATIYRAITGRKPPDSMERLAEDTMKKPSELGIKIDWRLEEALLKGLAVRAKDRWQSMGELYKAFYEVNPEKKNANASNQILNQERKRQLEKTQTQPEIEMMPKKPEQCPQPNRPNLYTDLDENLGSPKAEEDKSRKGNRNTWSGQSSGGFSGSGISNPTMAESTKPKKTNIGGIVAIVAVILVIFVAIGLSNLSQTSETAENSAANNVDSQQEKTSKDELSSDSSVAVGDTVTFGKENREWIVLDKETEKVLLLTKESIGERTYNDEHVDITWEDCTLRKWLNEDFYNDSFTEAEKNQICETTVKNDDNPKWGTEGGNDTTDKIFLLSIEEAEKYFENDEARAIGSWWWLRSPSYLSYSAADVSLDGNIARSNVYYKGSVRPALWVNLES